MEVFGAAIMVMSLVIAWFIPLEINYAKECSL